MIALDHDTLVFLSKTLGLFYLIALSIGVVIYAYWPRNKARFDAAAHAILNEEDRPCQ